MSDIDTRARRASVVGLLLPFVLAPPLPDGAVEAQDRAAMAYAYAGFVEEAVDTGEVPIILTTSLANGQEDRPYSRGVIATGSATLVFTISVGALPTGLTIDADTGVISGTPTTIESQTFTVKVENAEGNDTAQFTIDVVAAAGLPALTNAGVSGAGVSALFGVGTAEVSGP